jgi:hypothetical protein
MINYKEWNELRCGKLKLYNISTEIKEYYKDLNEDYHKILTFLIEHSGKGYTTIKDNAELIVHQPEASKRHTVPQEVKDWVDIVSKGGTEALNCFGAFYDKYTPKPKMTPKSKYYKFTHSDEFTECSDEYFKEKIKNLDLLSPEDWLTYRQKAKNGKIVAEEICNKIGNPNKNARLSPVVKKYLPKINRSNDRTYCSALGSMCVSRFGSWCKCHKLHQEETDSMQKVFEDKIKECGKEVYDALLAYSNALEEANSGLSKNVLLKVLDFVKTKKSSPFFADACNEFQKDKYLILHNINKSVWTAYKALKIHWRLKRRKPYIGFKSGKNYQCPFGLTGTGRKFDLRIVNNRLVVKINGFEEFVCMRSHYFSDLSIKKISNGFDLKFRHKLKDKRKEVFGDWIVGTVKEIKLLEDNGEWYLHLPYTITHKLDNLNLEKFFSFADPFNNKKFSDDKIKLSDKIIVGGYDLNISQPLTSAIAVLEKGSKEGTLNGLDYGMGTLLKSEILTPDSNVSKRIKILTAKMDKLINAIRQSKKVMDDDVKEWLKEEVGNVKHGNIRHQIQIVIGKYSHEKRKLRDICRKNGHDNLSESIRLLELMDKSNSLHNSYDNIHGKQHIFFRKTNDKRANFRKFVSKQYAAIIVKHCLANNINIAFLEDLEMNGDADEKNNSLGRLFAPGQLKKTITEALHKVGIGYVFVPPAGTSCKDPVSGMFGYRDKKYDKTKLYVIRDGLVGWLDADLVAAMNVLLLGLSHSVVPYRIFNKSLENKNRLSRRLSRFLKEVGRQLPKDVGKFYWQDGWIFENDKLRWVNDIEDKIKHLKASVSEIPQFSITIDRKKTYRSFQISEVLDHVKSLQGMELQQAAK